jgi:hypothetical protein
MPSQRSEKHMLVLQDTVFHYFLSIQRSMSLFCRAHRMLLLLPSNLQI